MLFPKEYFDEEHRDILSKMESFYTNSISINSAFWSEADIDCRFEAGDQTAWSNVYSDTALWNRRDFTYNYIRPITNVVSGFQRRNRKSTLVIPVENADTQTADQFSKIFSWIHRQEGVLETISEAFHGSIISGMNLLQVWVDYRSDPMSGNIKVDNCSYNSFLIDPFFKKADLSDCDSIWKRAFITKSQAMSLMPEYANDIKGMDANGNMDGKFQFMPESYNYSTNNLLIYDEFYYRASRTQRIIIDTQTGETMEWDNDDEDRLNMFLQSYPQVTVVDNEIPTVRMAIVVQGRVLYDGPNSLGIDVYPFVPVFAYYRPHLADFAQRIQGMVRGLRDPQFLLNRRKSIEFDILESQPNSGYIYKPTSLVNPKDIFLGGQGRGIPLKREAQMTDIQKIEAPQIPPSMVQLSDILVRMMRDISGANEELMGSAVDEKAGVLAMLRQGAGLTTLQGLFDQLDYSQKLLGKIILSVVQANFKPGKIKRIIEEEPTPQFYNKAFGRYDAAVEEGVNTTTQKQTQFAQLLHLREIGIQVPDHVILDATTIQDKSELIEAIKQQNQQQEQQQQQQAALAMEEQQARIALAQSRAAADQGLGIERLSRVDENQALAIERRAEAVKDREMGMLHLVRALKEIEDIDIRQVEKLLNLSQLLKAEEESVKRELNVTPVSGMSGVPAPAPQVPAGPTAPAPISPIKVPGTSI